MSVLAKFGLLAARPEKTAALPNEPHPVDVHVGQRIRQLRRELGGSQQWLAAHLNISFQQLQKYERGINRISASKLHEVATALDVPVGYFFQGLETHDTPQANSAQGLATPFLLSAEGAELTGYIQRLTPAARKAVMNAIKSLAALSTGGSPKD